MTDQLPIRFPVGRRVVLADCPEVGSVEYVSRVGVTVAFANKRSQHYSADWFRQYPSGLRLLFRLVPDGRDAD